MQLAVLPMGHEAEVWDMQRCSNGCCGLIARKITCSTRKRRLLIPEATRELQLLITLLEVPHCSVSARGKGTSRHGQ